MQSNRSPIELRARKTSCPPAITKPENKINPRIAKVAPIASKPIGKKSPNVAEQMNEIKDILTKQEKYFNDSIKSIREEINVKCTTYASIIGSMMMELMELKEKYSSNQLPNKIQPFWRDKTSSEVVNYMMRNMWMDYVEENYKCQLDELNKKVESLEKSMKEYAKITDDERALNVCECEYGLFGNFICNLHHNNREVETNKTNPFNLNNANDIVECIQDQIDNLGQAIHSNEEAIQEINSQINAISLQSNDSKFKYKNNNTKVNKKSQKVTENKVK